MAKEPEVQINAQDLKREKMQDTDNYYGKNQPYDFVLDENGDVYVGLTLEDI
jgi:hypothetical protein